MTLDETYCNAACYICSCESWEFNDLKTVAIQRNNSHAAIGIGSEFVMGVNFNGTFNTTNGDDDYIGFVFGFEDPSHFYVIYAANFNSSNGFNIDHQFRITKVNSISGLNGPYMLDAIIAINTVQNQTEVLWKDTVDRGWLPNKEYTWNLRFRPLTGQIQFELFEDSQFLFDTGVLSSSNITSNASGALGVFSHSQPETSWYDMWYECDNNPLI